MLLLDSLSPTSKTTPEDESKHGVIKTIRKVTWRKHELDLRLRMSTYNKFLEKPWLFEATFDLLNPKL